VKDRDPSLYLAHILESIELARGYEEIALPSGRTLRVPTIKVALTDQEVRDQAVTFLVAGHETTALALTFALFEPGRA
jgi:hypothetical protein